MWFSLQHCSAQGSSSIKPCQSCAFLRRLWRDILIRQKFLRVIHFTITETILITFIIEIHKTFIHFSFRRGNLYLLFTLFFSFLSGGRFWQRHKDSSVCTRLSWTSFSEEYRDPKVIDCISGLDSSSFSKCHLPWVIFIFSINYKSRGKLSGLLFFKIGHYRGGD